MKSLVKGVVRFSKVWMLALLCVLFLGVGIKAEAAPGQVTGVKQTGYASNGVEVVWNNTSGASKYLVEWCENNQFTGTTLNAENTTNNPFRFFGLGSAKSYYVRVTALDENGEAGTPSQPVEVVTSSIDKVTGLKQTKAENKKVHLTWNKVSNVNEYLIVYINKANTTKRKEVYTSNNSYTISGSADSAYGVFVYPVKRSSDFRAVGENYAFEEMATLPKKVTKVQMIESGTNTNAKAGIVVFSWKGSNAADGYEYEILGNNGKRILKKTITAAEYSSSNGYVTVKSGKLKNTQFMRIKVRGYTLVGKSKKPGTWSDVCYFAKCPNNIKHAPVNNRDLAAGVKVTWSKIAGAKDYTIYISTSSTGGWKKAGTTKKNSFVIKKCGSSTLKTGVMYYYKVVANKKVKGKTYTSDKDWYKRFSYVMRTYYY